MNYSRAVQGTLAQSGKLKAIQAAAETEINRQLSKEELSSLTCRFSLEELFETIEKVNVKIKS